MHPDVLDDLLHPMSHAGCKDRVEISFPSLSISPREEAVFSAVNVVVTIPGVFETAFAEMAVALLHCRLLGSTAPDHTPHCSGSRTSRCGCPSGLQATFTRADLHKETIPLDGCHADNSGIYRAALGAEHSQVP